MKTLNYSKLVAIVAIVAAVGFLTILQVNSKVCGTRQWIPWFAVGSTGVTLVLVTLAQRSAEFVGQNQILYEIVVLC